MSSLAGQTSSHSCSASFVTLLPCPCLSALSHVSLLSFYLCVLAFQSILPPEASWDQALGSALGSGD